jgi:hypothetical protein
MAESTIRDQRRSETQLEWVRLAIPTFLLLLAVALAPDRPGAT